VRVFFTFGDIRVVVNVPTPDRLKQIVSSRFAQKQGFALATVNLDHLAKMSANPAFARTYAQQDLVVADGRPIVGLSRTAGRPVELMPGSDLIIPLCQLAAEAGIRVALVGSTSIALTDAARVLREKVPGVQIVQAIAPSGDFDPQGDEALDVLKQLGAADIGLCFLALGAPKQEELALRGRDVTPTTGFASIGAGLDFLGGHQVRAPLWMRKIGLEWLWRMLSSPVRLVPRYARCVAILPREIHNARSIRLGKSDLK
jgi:exopolysaccharide biosynthesis WecB/TagA/CpsF family protein